MALTSTPTVGRLRASVLSALLAERFPLPAIKTADETVNGSATYQDDDELFLAVAANATYELTLLATQNSGATPGFKMIFTAPTGTTWLANHFDCGSSAANEQFGRSALTGFEVAGITGTGTDAVVYLHGLITIGSTAGTLQWQWAQNTSNASNTIVRAGSFLKLTRLG